MTTTDTDEMTPPPTSPPPIARLRRSRTDRIGAGVAGGLGDYFRVDPVLFRVLFATATFFGGAGALAYLLAWASIPEAGTEHAAVDGWVAATRRRRIPFWVIVGLGAILLWIVAFSWWAPDAFLPVIAVVVVLVVIFSRRSSDDADEQATARVGETRSWMQESRVARRARVRRAFPVKITTLLMLTGTLLTLALIDAVRGVGLPLYFWAALAILGAGLLTGMTLRRTPWSLLTLLIPTVAGLIGFAGTQVSLHDGVGQRTWTPKSTLSSTYRLAVGAMTLDLRSLDAQRVPRLVHVDQAAGQLRILAPTSMNLTVHANVHFGVVTVDGEDPHQGAAGLSVQRAVEPAATATGQPITIDVHLADGRVDIVRG